MNTEQLSKLPKWARACVEATMRQAALRWPTEPKPKPIDFQAELAGAPHGTLINGWSSHGYGDNFMAELGCSDGIHHSRSNAHKTDSQDAGVLYWSRREALIAARWQLCEQYAKTLARLDAQIESQPSAT